MPAAKAAANQGKGTHMKKVLKIVVVAAVLVAAATVIANYFCGGVAQACSGPNC